MKLPFPTSVAGLRRLSVAVSALIVATIFGLAIIAVHAARHMELNQQLWTFFGERVETRVETVDGLRGALGFDGAALRLQRLAAGPAAGTADAVAADIARLRGLIARYGELAAGPPEQDALADLGRVADDLERRLALLRTTPADGTAALAGLDTTIADGAAALAVLEIAWRDLAGEVREAMRSSTERGVMLVKSGLLVLPILILIASLIVWLMHRLVSEVGAREREVVERRQAQAALEAAQRETEAERQRAEAASQVKSQFLATVSHELRTPLTSIRGSLGLVVGGAAGELPARASGLVGIAHKNAERLVLLVNDILDIEKIESGRMEFRNEPVDLVELVQAAVEANQGYADAHGVRLRAAVGPAEAPVAGDRDRLMQVMANLVSNAAKFSPRGAEVTVALDAAADGRRWRLTVADRGPGIPEAFRGRVFERFAQADSSDTRSKGGTGLGLSITRAIVQHMGGDIGFVTAPGEGTTFHVELPVLARPPAAAAAAPVATVPAGGPRVLVCEDDRDVAHLLQILLEGEGYAVDRAHDAAGARALLAANRYDAATIDVMLPDGDGIALVRELRRRPETRDLPVLVISAAADAARLGLDSAGLGAVDWRDKPIDRERLSQALGRAAAASADGPRRVLHVEDDADVVAVVRGLLDGVAEVDAVATREAGRDRLAGQRYDLVILDAGLPDGSGLDLIADIHACRPAPQILIFSARDFGSDYASAVNATLVKSRSGNAELLATLRRLVGAGAAAREDGRRAHG